MPIIIMIVPVVISSAKPGHVYKLTYDWICIQKKTNTCLLLQIAKKKKKKLWHISFQETKVSNFNLSLRVKHVYKGIYIEKCLLA